VAAVSSDPPLADRLAGLETAPGTCRPITVRAEEKAPRRAGAEGEAP